VELWPEILSERDVIKREGGDTKGWEVLIMAVPMHELLRADCR
jgi:hypothetical protein